MRTARLMGAVGALTLTSIGMVVSAAPAYAAEEPNCETTRRAGGRPTRQRR
jgi:hypothetical protein